MYHELNAPHVQDDRLHTEHDVACADKDDIEVALAGRLGDPGAQVGWYQDTQREDHQGRDETRPVMARTCAWA